jgi:hypothetical protein
LYFYNVVWLLANVLRRRTPVKMRPAYMQLVGIVGLIPTIRRTSGWALRLMFGKIERLSRPPGSRVPMRSPVADVPASHATCETLVQLPMSKSRGVSLTVAG